MQEVYVNGSDFDSLEEVFAYLADELELEMNGNGLNAIYDALTELKDDAKITLDLSQVTDDDLLDGLERLAEVMGDAAEENEYLEVDCLE
ncbi:MAG: barstar family protein [Blautia sp.]|nr:barstar family protein [Blautia sp.]